MAAAVQGTIARLATDKGFGFIEHGANEYFFHRTAVVGGSFDDLRVGHVVTFEEEPSAKGPRASRVLVEGERC